MPLRNDSYSSNTIFPHQRPLKALINLSAFKQNILNIESFVGSAKPMIVLKADAYGHGMVELARQVPEYDLAVAIPEELDSLRLSGIKNNVWVLQGFFNESCLNHSKAIWVIHSLWQIDILKRYVQINEGVTIKVCLKLDTGMHRLGFSETDLDSLKQSLLDLVTVEVVCILSHFSMSDIPNNAKVFSQIKKFDQIIQDAGWGQCDQSLANSGGISFYPVSHRNWVRPGIMLYGASPSDGINLPIKIKPVMTLTSAIISLHHVKQGDFVGYGAAWTAENDALIATVAIGYADGYPRHAPNGTPVAVRCIGQENFIDASLVGRVSMDMITIDVTHIIGVSIGDIVELWGEHVSVDRVASLSGTISYELFTSVSKRVPREYF